MTAFSDAAHVLARPFTTYAALGAEIDPSPARALAWGVVALQLSIAAMVSLTTAGRLVAAHVVGPVLAWAFVPALQLVALAAAWASVRRESTLPFVRLAALYFAGHGPWYALFAAVEAVAIFAPDGGNALLALLGSGALPVALLVTIVWGAVLTAALFRAGARLTRARAARAVAIFYGCYVLFIVGYYTLVGQLLPLFGVLE